MTGPAQEGMRPLARLIGPRTALSLLTLHLLGAQALVGASALAVNVLAARALAPAGRGELALALQVSYLLGAFVLLGADKAYPAVMTAQPLRRALGHLAALLWLPSTVLACGCLLVGLLASPYRADALPYAAVLGLLTMANTAMAALRAAAVSARSGAGYLMVVFLAQGSLVTTCFLLLYTAVVDVLWWMLAYAASNLVPLLVLLRPRGAPAPHPVGLAEVRGLRRRIALSTVANMVLLRLDRLLVPLLTSTRELGLYVTVATMSELLYWPVQHYVDASVPSWREAHLAGRLGPRPILVLVGGYLVVAGLVAAVVVSLSVVPLFGPAYAESVDLVLPLVAAACCYGISRVGVGLALAHGRAGATTLIDGTGAAAMSAACLLWVPDAGAFGAALASLTGYGGAAAVSVLLYRRAARQAGHE